MNNNENELDVMELLSLLESKGHDTQQAKEFLNGIWLERGQEICSKVS